MTFTDTMHWTIAGVVILLILLMIALGVIAYRKWFRLYSIGTLVTLLVVGMWSIFVGGAQIAAEQPTPFFGVMERITVYGYLAWVAVLAIVLLRGERGAWARQAYDPVNIGQTEREIEREMK